MQYMKRILPICFVCILMLTGCGCKHEWKEATCTAPKTCALCQEVEGEALGHKWKEATCTEAKTCEVCNATEGSSLGHDFGDEEMVNPDFVSAAATFVKTCNTCKETEEREGTIEKLHDGTVVLMSADDFSDRFTARLMEAEGLLDDNQYLSFIDQTDGIISMYLCQRTKGIITEPGYFAMRDVDDKNISYDRHAENGVFMGVVGVVEGANQTVTAFAAMVGAMEPAMDIVETTSLVADWVTNPDEPMRLNGLAYTCTPMDDGLYLLGFAVVGE